jgi:hypothetical protein
LAFMPAKRLAASKASYPTATIKIKIIQNTPPPGPSCLLVVIEASETLQVCPEFRPRDEAGRLGQAKLPNGSYPAHTPAHEIIHVLCYGSCMGPEYDLGARLTAGIRCTPGPARVTPYSQGRPVPGLDWGSRTVHPAYPSSPASRQRFSTRYKPRFLPTGVFKLKQENGHF